MRMRNNILRTIFATSIGSILEFYDFAIYLFFAAYLSQEFFPEATYLISLSNTLAVFAVAYIVRPLGGLVMGHFSDLYGRRKVFSLTLLLMGFSTFLIGFIPPYQQMGGFSVVLLLLFRLLQGFSLGGETPGAITYIAEFAPKRKGFFTGVLFAGMNMGAILAVLVYSSLTALLTKDQMIHFGWRIPFILGGGVALLSFYVRRRLPEVFVSLSASHQGQKRIPLFNLLRRYASRVFYGFFIACLPVICAVLFFLYMPVYLTSILHFPPKAVAVDNTIALICYAILIVVVGWASDYIGRRIFFLLAALLALFVVFPSAMLLHDKIPLSLFYIVCATIGGIAMGALPAHLAEQFPERVRFSGVAFSYNICAAIMGGLTPLAATLFIRTTHDSLSPMLLPVFGGVVTVLALVFYVSQRVTYHVLD